MKLIKKILRLAGMGTGLAILAFGFSDPAATVTVFVGNTNLTGIPADVFVPVATNANVNDQVVWVWEGSNHSTTSGTNGVASGLWNSGVASGPHSFTNTFTSPGRYVYYCSVHVSVGMTGAVTIASADLPPTVSITNPPAGFTFSAPASFTLAATASDSDGAVTGVEFFEGATSLGTVSSSPYSAPVNNLSAGDYTFSAVATDNGGLTATNAIAIHVVTATPIVLSATQFLPPSDFRFNYTANPGLNYIVQRSADLTGNAWTTLVTNQAAASPVIFNDTNAALSPGYYRVGLLPNP